MSNYTDLFELAFKACRDLEQLQKGLQDEDRLQLWRRLQADYCEYCGRYDADNPSGCQCMNDE